MRFMTRQSELPGSTIVSRTPTSSYKRVHGGGGRQEGAAVRIQELSTAQNNIPLPEAGTRLLPEKNAAGALAGPQDE